jgi:hypothetical protein
LTLNASVTPSKCKQTRFPTSTLAPNVTPRLLYTLRRRDFHIPQPHHLRQPLYRTLDRYLQHQNTRTPATSGQHTAVRSTQRAPAPARVYTHTHTHRERERERHIHPPLPFVPYFPSPTKRAILPKPGRNCPDVIFPTSSGKLPQVCTVGHTSLSARAGCPKCHSCVVCVVLDSLRSLTPSLVTFLSCLPGTLFVNLISRVPDHQTCHHTSVSARWQLASPVVV